MASATCIANSYYSVPFVPREHRRHCCASRPTLPVPTQCSGAPALARLTLRSMQQKNQIFLAAFAVNDDSPVETKGIDDNEGTKAPQDPPLATILAGFLVFFAVCWMFGSILLWLLSFVSKLLFK